MLLFKHDLCHPDTNDNCQNIDIVASTLALLTDSRHQLIQTNTSHRVHGPSRSVGQVSKAEAGLKE